MVTTNAPAAMMRVSPTPMVRAVCKVPYHNISDEATGDPSHNWIPRMDPVDENGPNVIAAELEAVPSGEVAAENSAVIREYPVKVPISDPETEVGVPAANPAHSAAGRVGLAPPRHQSRYAFERSFVLLPLGLLFQASIHRWIGRTISSSQTLRCRALVGWLLLGLTA